MLLNIQKNLIRFIFYPNYMLYNIKTTYICNVFFMVLDLRLMKIGCRETANFFCPLFKLSRTPVFMYPLSLGQSPNKFASAIGLSKTFIPMHLFLPRHSPNKFASALGYRKRSAPVVIRKFLKKSYITYCQ